MPSMNYLPSLLCARPMICASPNTNWWSVFRQYKAVRQDTKRLRTTPLCRVILVLKVLPVSPPYLELHPLHANRYITTVFASWGMASLALTRVAQRVSVGLCASLMLSGLYLGDAVDVGKECPAWFFVLVGPILIYWCLDSCIISLSMTPWDFVLHRTPYNVELIPAVSENIEKFLGSVLFCQSTTVVPCQIKFSRQGIYDWLNDNYCYARFYLKMNFYGKHLCLTYEKDLRKEVACFVLLWEVRCLCSYELMMARKCSKSLY